MANQYKAREYEYRDGILYQKCSICEKRLAAECYPREKGKKFWIICECKECHKLKRESYHREWYKKNKETAKERFREYHKNNRERLNNKIKYRAERHSRDVWFTRDSFHKRAKKFVKDNWLRPEICPICWVESEILLHHPSYDSYDKRSYVVFCCKGCHSAIHLWKIECPNPVNLLECNSH